MKKLQFPKKEAKTPTKNGLPGSRPSSPEREVVSICCTKTCEYCSYTISIYNSWSFTSSGQFAKSCGLLCFTGVTLRQYTIIGMKFLYRPPVIKFTSKISQDCDSCIKYMMFAVGCMWQWKLLEHCRSRISPHKCVYNLKSKFKP